MPKFTINNMGNDNDVYCHLIHHYPTLTIGDMEEAIADEMSKAKRKTRIKLIERAIRRKKAGKLTFNEKE